MGQSIASLFRSVVSIFLALFKKPDSVIPLPVPPPLPAGVPPTPAPIPIPPSIPVPLPTKRTLDVQLFVQTWNNRFVPPKFGGDYQCVALVNEFVHDFNGTEWPRLSAAGDFVFRNIPGFVFIANTPDNVPQEGDIVEWGRSSNLPWGHIGIFRRGDVMHLVTFDQNWPLHSPAHEQAHTYVGVSGWHRPLNWA